MRILREADSENSESGNEKERKKSIFNKRWLHNKKDRETDLTKKDKRIVCG